MSNSRPCMGLQEIKHGRLAIQSSSLLFQNLLISKKQRHNSWSSCCCSWLFQRSQTPWGQLRCAKATDSTSKPSASFPLAQAEVPRLIQSALLPTVYNYCVRVILALWRNCAITYDDTITVLLLTAGPRWLMPRMYCSHIGLLYYP